MLYKTLPEGKNLGECEKLFQRFLLAASSNLAKYGATNTYLKLLGLSMFHIAGCSSFKKLYSGHITYIM